MEQEELPVFPTENPNLFHESHHDFVIKLLKDREIVVIGVYERNKSIRSLNREERIIANTLGLKIENPTTVNIEGNRFNVIFTL